MAAGNKGHQSARLSSSSSCR